MPLTHEGCDLIDGSALRSPLVDRRVLVLVTDRHSAIELEFFRNLEEAPDEAVSSGPRLLHAAGESFLFCRKRDRLHEHAQMGPLSGAHLPVERKEERGRCS